MNAMPELAVVISGAVPDDAVAHARAVVERLVRHAPGPVLFARLKLSRSDDPAVAKRASVQVSFDVDGRIVRAHLAAHTFREAMDLVVARIRQRLDVRGERREARWRVPPRPEPGEWRHVNVSEERPTYFPRPVEERRVVRHKVYGVAETDVDEAAFDMDMLDYDFHLFTNVATGSDAVVFRRDDGQLGLRQASGGDPGDGTWARPVVDPDPAPELTTDQARERLDTSGERFVFFVDPQTRRGAVMYRRYDGHYGVIQPEAQPAAHSSGIPV
jgi:hypothetical protein